MNKILQIVLLLLLMVLNSCKSGNETTFKVIIAVDTTTFNPENNDNTDKQSESECDSLKFSDFKNNLKEVEVKITSALKNEIDSIANNFIKKQCNDDSLYCSDIYRKFHKQYKVSGCDLFSFAYAFENSEIGMEKSSASFFVFGIIQDEKIIFHDIVDDLIGEIKLELSGLELKDNATIIWGEMYPYFSSQEYGKFKLTIYEEGEGYEFQCKSNGH